VATVVARIEEKHQRRGERSGNDAVREDEGGRRGEESGVREGVRERGLGVERGVRFPFLAVLREIDVVQLHVVRKSKVGPIKGVSEVVDLSGFSVGERLGFLGYGSGGDLGVLFAATTKDSGGRGGRGARVPFVLIVVAEVQERIVFIVRVAVVYFETQVQVSRGSERGISRFQRKRGTRGGNIVVLFPNFIVFKITKGVVEIFVVFLYFILLGQSFWTFLSHLFFLRLSRPTSFFFARPFLHSF
jgi:hypothetical protein